MKKLSISACPQLKQLLPETTSAVGTNDNVFNSREKQEKSELIVTTRVIGDGGCVFMCYCTFLNDLLCSFGGKKNTRHRGINKRAMRFSPLKNLLRHIQWTHTLRYNTHLHRAMELII